MRHPLLTIGIDYRGKSSPLSGCIRDAGLWRDLFAPISSGKLQLTESQATKSAVVSALKAIAKECSPGSDSFGIVTFSGHGTFRTGSQDAGEIDGRDEAICCYDYDRGGLLWDNEIATILAGSQLLFITDCCHSGTMTRTFIADSEDETRPRYIPFDQICEGMLPCEVNKICEGADQCRPLARHLRDASGALPGVIHLAGCEDDQYSYDTSQGGAMTLAAIASYKSLPEGAVHQQWIDLIKTKLPTRQFPQNPRMTATAQDFRRVLPGKEPPSAAEQPIASTGDGVLTLGGKVYDVRERK